jgi:hypothetical protein
VKKLSFWGSDEFFDHTGGTVRSRLRGGPASQLVTQRSGDFDS